jgi:hypothetical protein
LKLQEQRKSALAGKRQQIFMAAAPTSYPGKTIMKITAFQVTLDYLPDIGAKKSILSLIALFVNLLKGFKHI